MRENINHVAWFHYSCTNGQVEPLSQLSALTVETGFTMNEAPLVWFGIGYGTGEERGRDTSIIDARGRKTRLSWLLFQRLVLKLKHKRFMYKSSARRTHWCLHVHAEDNLILNNTVVEDNSGEFQIWLHFANSL